MKIDALLIAASDPWGGSFLSGFDPHQRFSLVLTVIGCATGVVITLGKFAASYANTAQRRRLEADLKREMLDRGMSADEIVKIIESSAPSEDFYARAVDAWGKRKKR
jgi:hypothetical protein